ncbi:helix-turn-helix domain-containing protein [Phytohabitans sp. ZYX-F-186]|uniref:Helix-turn-helix domain-containing protein n=1 Tax=Phytohabitans maris TaxID=3071409 RepID=A0ABU0ZVK7_9ACTN|nr:helix-turn-helix domain-containing protein [Phytohabitans sp. ZYX-F-186]MDQ7910220.1 helix-turn-helix domain-containing protein [Phytohabitans sp. ZYX-F-186]
MTSTTPPGDGFYRPAEVAQKLRCSEWWVKEQARNRRIPYRWIGGSYLFTDEDIAEILRLFKREPLAPVPSIPTPRRSPEQPSDMESRRPGFRLTARVPRRARTATADNSARQRKEGH